MTKLEENLRTHHTPQLPVVQVSARALWGARGLPHLTSQLKGFSVTSHSRVRKGAL